VNELPLTLEGPGGKKRQDQPNDIIEKYYNGGPNQKHKMATDFAQTQKEFKHMMSNYTDYFKDLTPFMEKWYGFVQVACGFEGSYEYHHPHRILIQIIDEAIIRLGHGTGDGYEGVADEEKKRREKEKADISEAISKQITVAALLKERSRGTEAVFGVMDFTIWPPPANSPPPVVAYPRPSTPLRITIPTAQSPDTGRAVKKSRGNSPVTED
jgi:hypothetical protein